jgi:hypothetical protein
VLVLISQFFACEESSLWAAGRDVVDVRRRKLLTAENKKCLVHSQQLAFVFVVDETQFPEPVHKEANISWLIAGTVISGPA